MAITIPGSTDRVVTIEEFLDYVGTHVDLRDTDSIVESAPMLRALANNRTLVLERLNRQVKSLYSRDTVDSAQTVFLGKGDGFFVRANIWPSTADISAGRVYQDQFAYDAAHDHNYSFLTVGYFGPGYVTEIYEYDPDSVEGYAGEPVELRFLERTKFGAGSAMFYRASRDVHIQYAPDDLSITINMMILRPEVMLRDQYFFDLESRTLMGFPPQLDSSRRVSIVRMAGYTGDADTAQLLADLARTHPCRRTRLAAFEALAQLQPPRAAEIWETACRDREPLVAHAAQRRLTALGA
ncbi:MAG: HEAT repeat domain-containing protein [Gammaproteobacteria bacterium]